MKPAPVDYEAPTQLSEAVALLADPDRDAIVIAGGQSLVPMLNLRLARPDLLVDLRLIEGLDEIAVRDGQLVIGAMATKRAAEMSSAVAESHPLFHASTLLVGHPQIRNRGTVGGSMAHADPAAEYPAVALACDAVMKAVGPDGERLIAARDFFEGFLSTALEQGELLCEVRLPVMEPTTGWAIEEMTRRDGDFAMVGVVVVMPTDANSEIRDPRIVLFGVGSTPVRVPEAEAALVGHQPGAGVFEEAASVVPDAIDEPGSDIHASSEYRRHLAGVLTRRALETAATRIGQNR